MFIIFLKFSDDKTKAKTFMEGHNAWIRQGFNDGIFLGVGSLKPNLGGCVLAHHTSLEDIQKRVNEDPFVQNNIVTAEVMEMEIGKADERLSFLTSQ